MFEELTAAGWSADVAEALAENEYSAARAALLSAEEVLDLYLTWNGIIGFTGGIIRALDNCREMATANG